MRMSCNGCRVLRKGCSENCSIRPCLQWIKSSDSQANATVFLAKFYGRAGLMNLINAGPDHLRPAIFRSLLHEACGRIVNPIYGSVGLMWSGQWQLCQNAVDAVLKGAPITPIATDDVTPPVKGYDIRHVTKDDNSNSHSNSSESHRVKPTKTTKFKRAGSSKSKPNNKANSKVVSESTRREAAGSSTSHESTVSHPDEGTTTDASVASVEADVETRENGGDNGVDDGEVELELTLRFGLGLMGRSSEPKSDKGACKMELGLV